MSDFTGNDSLTFVNDKVDLDVFDKATVGFQITGTWVGTITWTASIDGTNFFAVTPFGTDTLTTTGNANVWFNVVALTRLKMTMTAYTSGTAVINYVADDEILTGLPTLGGGDSVSTAQTFSVLAAGSNNATVLKATPGSIYNIEITNTSAAIKYVKFYNKATAPAPATDNALLIKRYGIAATSNLVVSVPKGIPFTTGIGLAAVTGTSDTDNTGVTAADLMINVTFR